MKLSSKPSTKQDFAWFLGLGALLFGLYVFFKYLGYSDSDSKGISLLALLLTVGLGFVVYRKWLRHQTDRHSAWFKGLQIEQQLIELEKMMEAQVAAGVVTRVEYDEMKVKARAKFARDGFSESKDSASK